LHFKNGLNPCSKFCRFKTVPVSDKLPVQSQNGYLITSVVFVPAVPASVPVGRLFDKTKPPVQLLMMFVLV